MDKIKVIKGVVSFIISMSVGSVSSRLIMGNLPVSVKPLDKVLTRIGEFSISSLVAGKASSMVENDIDDLLKPKSVPEDFTI